MARPLIYNRANIVGQGIDTDPLSINYGRHRLSRQKIRCSNCNAIMFQEEKTSGTINNAKFSLCCSSGKFDLPQLQPIPHFLKQLLTTHHQTALGQDLIEKIRSYNSVFAFTSFNCKVINYLNLFFEI